MRQLYLIIVSLFLVSGCSQVVRVSHSNIKPSHALDTVTDGIQAKVLVQPPAIANQVSHNQFGLFLVGPQNTWTVDLNTSLPDAVQDVISQTYENVSIGKSCSDCGLIVRPKVTQIDVEKLSMKSSVELELGIYDAYGREVTTIRAGGNSSYMDGKRFGVGVVGYFVPLFGTAVGTHLVSHTVKNAFDDALANIHEQLSYEANSGVLARSWLPKGTSGKYAPGKHQYTAEQIAKGAGCDLNSDAVRLTKEQYYTETYTASCWGQPQFSVICEFGRCEVHEQQGLAHNP